MFVRRLAPSTASRSPSPVNGGGSACSLYFAAAAEAAAAGVTN